MVGVPVRVDSYLHPRGAPGERLWDLSETQRGDELSVKVHVEIVSGREVRVVAVALSLSRLALHAQPIPLGAIGEVANTRNVCGVWLDGGALVEVGSHIAHVAERLAGDEHARGRVLGR